MVDVVCAGHICLDFTPKFPKRGLELKDIFIGGKQSDVENMEISTGGSVANTGVALNKLGMNTPLMAKIGDDIIGDIIGKVLVNCGGNSEYLSVAKGEDSSYSVVLAVPGCDRIFLHNAAVNDTFTADNINFDVVEQAKLFHFGYAPLMKQMYINGGNEFEKIMRQAKERGVTTSVDTAQPDATSVSGQSDWNKIFEKTLPYTDIFVPSIEEILLMTDRDEYFRLKSLGDDILENILIDDLTKIGERMINMGAAVVVLKCGTLGYYVKTADVERIKNMGKGAPADVENWANKEIFSGIFKVEDVKSATGAGDTSVAGFLAALLRGCSLERTITLACATGAFCVTDYSATGAIVPIENIMQKVDSGWEKRPVNYTGNLFSYDEEHRMYFR